MKLKVYSLILAFTIACAGIALAQQANLTTPETSTNLKASTVFMGRVCNCASITVDFLDASGNTKRTINYAINNPADVVSLLTAMETVRATETGNSVRKMNFRVLGWLQDNSKLVNDVDGSIIGATLVP